MQRLESRGHCQFCGFEGSQAEVVSHLETCQRRPQPKGRTTRYQLVVADRYYEGSFWLYLDISGNATLTLVDQFLRDLWVECCGHSSAFRYKKNLYIHDPEKNFLWDEQSMDIQLKDILQQGIELEYQYDFTATTYLQLDVITVEEKRSAQVPVRLLARNKMPELICSGCNKVDATCICKSCRMKGEYTFLCAACAVDHPCSKDQKPAYLYLPLVNSPRMGICQYTGENSQNF